MTFDDAPDDTRARLEQLAGDRTAADAAVAAAKERSKMIDTVAAPIGVSGNADFVLLTGADGNIEKAEWMKGEESLRPLASSIVRRKTQFQSPDPSVSAILRLGQVKCLNGKCELTLVAANKAGALVPEETANNLLPDEVLRSVPALAAQPPVAAPETDFFNPEVGMKVHLPEGWRLVSETKPTFTTPAQSVLVKVGSLAFFILQREHLEASPEMYRKLRQEHMSSAPNLTVLGESSAVVDGKNADRVTFKVTQEAAELRGWMMFVDNGDEHYGILAMAPADIFDRYAPMYTAMTQSVRFAWRHPEDDFAKSGAASLDREVPGGIATIPPPATASRLRVRVSQTVSQGQLINKVYPKYPAEAKAGHIQGPVVLQVTINQQGEVADLKVLTGNPMLVQAAIDAVKQWRYRPYLFQGKPVEVETTITVNFTLEGN
jgi:TonB family protein